MVIESTRAFSLYTSFHNHPDLSVRYPYPQKSFSSRDYDSPAIRACAEDAYVTFLNYWICLYLLREYECTTTIHLGSYSEKKGG